MCCHSQADWKIRIIIFHWNNLRLFPTLQKLFSTRNPAASGATVAESRPLLCFCSHFTQCGQQMTRIKKNCAWLLSLLKPPPPSAADARLIASGGGWEQTAAAASIGEPRERGAVPNCPGGWQYTAWYLHRTCSLLSICQQSSSSSSWAVLLIKFNGSRYDHYCIVCWIVPGLADSASKSSIRRFVPTRQGLLLVESGYYRFHIKDTIKTLC